MGVRCKCASSGQSHVWEPLKLTAAAAATTVILEYARCCISLIIATLLAVGDGPTTIFWWATAECYERGQSHLKGVRYRRQVVFRQH